ncbi:MAG: phage tail protein [Sphingomicrobium sp.]
MATLVLSTVGTLLGGPVGGAIGSLVGQSIDQQIFRSPRRGPRLGDLSVQTSSYDTQIPRIYGTMRVAGSIIWSTDLVESTQTSGAKGQPDTTYSYSVSFAVALSSRRLVEIRRIWADGKLLRGEAGDFKINTEFRFYQGTEAQDADPLIGSIEGVDATPAYRGISLAVFENLELAEFGNRIPFLTFEVVADVLAPSIHTILADASSGAIDCGAAGSVGGYAAMGRSIRDAVEPIVDSFAVDLVDDGSILRSPLPATTAPIDEDDLGCSADGANTARLARDQIPARSLPSFLSLTYYDAERDYQTGQARSDVIGQSSTTEAKVELPAVLPASDARLVAEQMIARRWAQRDKLTLRLPPRFMTLKPGTEVDTDFSPGSWRIEHSTIDGMVVVAELRPVWRPQASVAADPGRFLPPSDVVIGNLALALVELPDLTDQAGLNPTVHLAASTPAPIWKRLPVEVSSDQFFLGVRTAHRKAVLGSAETLLPDGDPEDIDTVNSVEVELVDPNQWLSSCDDEALAGGTNLALIGDELIQFADAEAIGPGRFRLTRLLRGRYATHWAMNLHASGDLFLMIDLSSLQVVSLPKSARGMVVTASCQSAEGPVTSSRLVDGRSLRSGLFIDGEQVVGSRTTAIATPSGGTNVDAEARAAVSQILTALRGHGLIDA